VNAHVFKPDMPPPVKTVGVFAWMRANLFSSWLNTLLTLFAAELRLRKSVLEACRFAVP